MSAPSPLLAFAQPADAGQASYFALARAKRREHIAVVLAGETGVHELAPTIEAWMTRVEECVEQDEIYVPYDEY